MTRVPEAALAEWTARLGTENVLEGEARTPYRRTTFLARGAAEVVLRPDGVDAVRDCLTIARRHRLAVWPSSRGRNLGYGGHVPPEAAVVVMDLRRLSSIRSFDRELGVIEVEPGVTQTAAAEFLAREGGEWVIDPTTAPGDASLLANALERGHGLGPLGDHSAHLAGLRVMLGDGTLLKTGWGEFEGAQTFGLDEAAPGPQITGLFLQSSLGLVLSGHIHLSPAPERAVLGTLDLADDDALRRALPLLRQAKLRGLVQNGPNIVNHYRLLAQSAMRVEALVGACRPLPRAESLALAAATGLPRWRAFFSLVGDEAMVRAGAGRATDLFASQGLVARFIGLDEPPRTDGEQQMLDILCGCVSEVGMRRMYWRMPLSVPPGDPEADGCGFVWLSTTLPFAADALFEVTSIVEDLIIGAGFEPDVSFGSIRGRTLNGRISIVFNRLVSGEDERVLAVHDAVRDALGGRGYHPYRLGIQSMESMNRMTLVARTTLQRLKVALDPDGGLASGRYSADPERGSGP